MKTLVSASGFTRRIQPAFSFRSLELPGTFNLEGIRIDRLLNAFDNAITSVKKFVIAFINDAIEYKSVDNKVRRAYINRRGK